MQSLPLYPLAVFRLSLVGRNLSALEATRARCVELGCYLDNVLIIKCDLRSELECQQAVRKTTHFYGGLRDFPNITLIFDLRA